MTAWLRSSDRDPIEELRAALRGKVPDDVFTMFDDYVDDGEPVVGLEQLYDDLGDRQIVIDAEIAELFISAGTRRKVERIRPERVRAMVQPAGDDEKHRLR